MTANYSSDPMASDADLIRYIDGELSRDERRRVDAELASNTELTQRMETLRRRSLRLRSLLQATDPSNEETEASNPVPDRGTIASRARELGNTSIQRRRVGDEPRSQLPTVWLRAAAVLIVLIGGAMVVPPVRAWVIAKIQQITSGDDVSPTLTPPVDAAPLDTLPMRFPVEGTLFEVSVANAQADGRLTIRSTESTTGALTIEGRISGENPLFSTDRLAIQNSAASTADYTIALPANIRTVVVRVAGRVVSTFELAAGQPEHVIDLRAGRH